VLSVVNEKDRFNEQSKAPKRKPTKDYVRIYKPFMQNKPNFMRFSPENDDFTKKQTQLKPKQSQFNPKQSQFKANFTTLKVANCLPLCSECLILWNLANIKFRIKGVVK
jgi:hypothetical protein